MLENRSFGYTVNKTKVVFEKFDDEVVLINLENGNYFSIRNIAKDVWTGLEAGASAEQISTAVSERFPDFNNSINSEVKEFIGHLLQEELIIGADEMTAGAFELTSSEYVKPVLEVYSDMQDLILLDPIHEVDETGWPNLKATNTQQ